MRIDWQKETDGCMVARIGNITLCAAPEHTRMRKLETVPARGTKWRASCSQWVEATRTIQRFGAWGTPCDTKQQAMRQAEKIYNDARQEQST